MWKNKAARIAKAILGGKKRTKLEDLILVYLISKYKAIIKWNSIDKRIGR